MSTLLRLCGRASSAILGAVYDRDVVYKILDEGFMHLGFAVESALCDSTSYATKTTCSMLRLLCEPHAPPAALVFPVPSTSLFRRIGLGAPFSSLMNYRSVVVLGTAT